MATVLKSIPWPLGVERGEVVCKSRRKTPVAVGTIYFIGPREGMVKIGFTNDVATRLKRLQMGSPVPLFVLAVAENRPMTDERDYHRRFAYCREHGEWFLRTIGIDEEIDRLNMTSRESV